MTVQAAVLDAAVVDCDALARDIAVAAQRESARTGRICRLRDAAAVAMFLRALASGGSQRAAAKRAQLSEGAVRRWLLFAACDTSPGVHAQFKAAVDAIANHRQAAERDRAHVEEQQRQIATRRAVVVENVTPPASSEPRPVPKPPEPSIHPYTIWRWHLLLERAASSTVPAAADELRREAQGEMMAYGLRTLPPRPALLLPRGLPFDRVQQMYLEWARLTYQETPTERMLESLARSWYWEHRAPVAGMGSAS